MYFSACAGGAGFVEARVGARGSFIAQFEAWKGLSSEAKGKVSEVVSRVMSKRCGRKVVVDEN
jgi:hypothetical protein